MKVGITTAHRGLVVTASAVLVDALCQLGVKACFPPAIDRANDRQALQAGVDADRRTDQNRLESDPEGFDVLAQGDQFGVLAQELIVCLDQAAAQVGLAAADRGQGLLEFADASAATRRSATSRRRRCSSRSPSLSIGIALTTNW